MHISIMATLRYKSLKSEFLYVLSHMEYFIKDRSKLANRRQTFSDTFEELIVEADNTYRKLKKLFKFFKSEESPTKLKTTHESEYRSLIKHYETLFHNLKRRIRRISIEGS